MNPEILRQPNLLSLPLQNKGLCLWNILAAENVNVFKENALKTKVFNLAFSLFLYYYNFYAPF